MHKKLSTFFSSFHYPFYTENLTNNARNLYRIIIFKDQIFFFVSSIWIKPKLNFQTDSWLKLSKKNKIRKFPKKIVFQKFFWCVFEMNSFVLASSISFNCLFVDFFFSRLIDWLHEKKTKKNLQRKWNIYSDNNNNNIVWFSFIVVDDNDDLWTCWCDFVSLDFLRSYDLIMIMMFICESSSSFRWMYHIDLTSLNDREKNQHNDFYWQNLCVWKTKWKWNDYYFLCLKWIEKL